MDYELLLIAQVTGQIYHTSYELLYIARVEISLLHGLFISLVGSLQNQVILVSYSSMKYFMDECSNIKL